MWPWQSGGHRIKDLKSHELMEVATSVMQKVGRNALSVRLVYRVLELDSFQPQALLILVDYFTNKTKVGRPTGDEAYAGMIIEHAFNPKSPLTVEQKRVFDKARGEVMKAWGFVAIGGQESDSDYLGYMSFVNDLVTRMGSLSGAIKAAMTKLGVQAGILDPVKGTPNRVYQEWLNADTSTLRR
jgi:hypothetical protein